MLLIYLIVNYLYRKYGVPLHNFFENLTRGISHLKLHLHYQCFLGQSLQRKLGQSFLGQVHLFTLSKLFEELVQEIIENVLKSSKYVNISH